MSIIDVAVNKAVALLAAAGVPYAILMPDGSTLGQLSVAPAKAARTRRYNFTVTGYVEKMAAMKIGDIIVVEAGELPKAKLRGTMQARACAQWGNESCVFGYKGNAVECLRVS